MDEATRIRQIDFLERRLKDLREANTPERLLAQNEQLKRELGHAVSAVHEQRKARWPGRALPGAEVNELKRQVQQRDAELARVRKERDLAASKQTCVLPSVPAWANGVPPEPPGYQEVLAQALHFAGVTLEEERRRPYSKVDKVDLEAMATFARDWAKRIPAGGAFSSLGLYWWALMLTAHLLKATQKQTGYGTIRDMHIAVLEQWGAYMKQRAAWELHQPATLFLPSHKG